MFTVLKQKKQEPKILHLANYPSKAKEYAFLGSQKLKIFVVLLYKECHKTFFRETENSKSWNLWDKRDTYSCFPFFILFIRDISTSWHQIGIRPSGQPTSSLVITDWNRETRPTPACGATVKEMDFSLQPPGHLKHSQEREHSSTGYAGLSGSPSFLLVYL